MTKPKDTGEAVVIPKEMYQDDLEEQVKNYVILSTSLPRNEYKFKHVEIPKFKSDYEQEKWEREEVRRCVNGYNGITGKMYFFFNYCYMLDVDRGRIRPDFRVCDNEWFNTLEQCSKDNWGLVCVKRRRVGASWKEAGDVVHDAMFKPFYNIGMNSKTERDSIELFKKVKFIYDNLPSFLRASTSAGNTRMSLDFAYKAKDENGNTVRKGTQSTITVVAPTDTAYEGLMLNKWICDEAGKLSNLPQLWSYTEPCLMTGVTRPGIPVLFGTSGDVGKDGAGLREMWKNADVYRLRRFFFAGWMGILTDEYGNDMKEEAIRWIVYERDRRKNLSAKQYNDFVQQFPLTVEEAFQQANEGGLGDIYKINKQKASLAENPAKKIRGSFLLKDGGDVVFRPDVKGHCIVYEHPDKELNGGYVAGCDPADHDLDDPSEASDLSLYIMKKATGLDGPKIVFEYTHRPSNLREYYKQALCALIYYNNAKVLIERNRYRMISYFDEEGFKYLLQTTPQTVTRVVGGKTNTIGVNMTPAAKELLEEMIDEYVDDYCEYIPSEELLDEFIVYGSVNTDKAMAFGICLMLLKEDKRKVQKIKGRNPNIPSVSFKKVNGRIVRVTA